MNQGKGKTSTGAKDSPAVRTLGPVSDLERHLPSDWWRNLFNSLYLKTDGDVVENPENTSREVDLFTRILKLESNDRILDLCCGQGRHCMELARRGFKHITGVDRSRYLIRLARKRARSQGLNIEYHEADARRYRASKTQYSCIMVLGNSFGYFEDEQDDQALLRNVSRLLMPNGTFILDVVDGDWMRQNFQNRSWEWIDQNHFVCRERSLARDGQRIVSREVIVHAEKGVIVDQFYAERLYTSEGLQKVLEDLGFRHVRCHGNYESDSTRGQDLGMMENRLIVTAQAPQRQVVSQPAKSARISQVTVLLGDPSLPDKIKVDGRFNPEDIETIDRLKHALGELEGYSFEYLDSHPDLIRTLLVDPPKFVLNLCDEGYLNDATQELHVPVLLEMLQIPYSGSGPACLGLCYDKGLVRAIAESLEIPVPLESYVGQDDMLATIPATFPAIVKPNFGDSSFGITQRAVVSDITELLNYISWIRKEIGPGPILVQEFLGGPEYSIAIIGNPGLSQRVLPPLQVDYSNLDPGLPRILCYESKWLPDSPYWNQIQYREASLDDNQYRQLVDYSNRLFERLGIRDYARFDFRSDESGTIKLMEVNPNPGWCWDGKLNLMAGMEQLRYSDLLRLLLEAAQERVAGSAESRTG